jgi:hypothetical protein
MLNDACNLMAACGSLDPIFVLPVSSTLARAARVRLRRRALAGRKTGTGSAAISSPVRRAARRADIVGFRKTSLLRMIMSTGNTPLDASSGNYSSLEEIRRKATRPLVVFPECTTSNGRGLLRFAEVFRGRAVPVKGYKVFVLCVSGTYVRPVLWIWSSTRLQLRSAQGFVSDAVSFHSVGAESAPPCVFSGVNLGTFDYVNSSASPGRVTWFTIVHGKRSRDWRCRGRHTLGRLRQPDLPAR